MSLNPQDLEGNFRDFGKSKLIFSKSKYFTLHFNLSLTRLLGLQDGDHVQVFCELDKGVLILKLLRAEKKERKK